MISEQETDVGSHTKQVQVLVVDDDEDDRWLMAEAFRQVRPAVGVRYFTDGKDVIAYLDNATDWPVLLITDLNMTIIGGLELVQNVRSHRLSDQVYIAVWTTSKEPDDLTRCHIAGADDCVSKPHALPDLVAWVRELADIWL